MRLRKIIMWVINNRITDQLQCFSILIINGISSLKLFTSLLVYIKIRKSYIFLYRSVFEICSRSYNKSYYFWIDSGLKKLSFQDSNLFCNEMSK